MRPVGTALELRVKLGTHEPGVVRQLDDFYQAAVWGQARQPHTAHLHLRPEIVVELVAVAVALGDLCRAIQLPAAGALRQHAGVAAQPHGAALGGDIHLVRHQVDDRVGGGGKFGGAGVCPAQHVAGELDHRHLHPQADAEVGNAAFPGVPHGRDHALDAPVAEAAGHQDAAAARQPLRRTGLRQGLRVHPPDVYYRVVGGARMVQGLHHGEVGVVELGVLAHQGDGHPLAGVLLPLHHGAPLPQIRLVSDEAQLPAHHLVQTLLGHQQGHLIQRLRRGVLDDAVRLDIAEQGNLPADVLCDGHVAPAYQNIRLDAQGQKLLHGVLGGLALQLAAAGDLDDEGHVDEHHIPLGPLRRHLPDSLQEGLGLNVAHGAADLRDDHVHVLFRHGVDAALDLVGDVGDDLHRGAQVVAPALPVQHGPVDLAGGHGAVAGEVLVHEPLVVAQVQVRLGPVLGDEHLAVLIGTHSPRVHIDIGVELLVPHPDAPLLQKPPQGGRADPLAQAGDHAAGNEYKFR